MLWHRTNRPRQFARKPEVLRPLLGPACRQKKRNSTTFAARASCEANWVSASSNCSKSMLVSAPTKKSLIEYQPLSRGLAFGATTAPRGGATRICRMNVRRRRHRNAPDPARPPASGRRVARYASCTSAVAWSVCDRFDSLARITGRQSPQLVVHQGQQLSGGVGVVFSTPT